MFDMFVFFNIVFFCWIIIIEMPTSKSFKKEGYIKQETLNLLQVSSCKKLHFVTPFLNQTKHVNNP